jgi:putative ABC transport system permease protein
VAEGGGVRYDRDAVLPGDRRRPVGIWRLVFSEILHRRLNFTLGLLSVVVAVGCLVGALTLLRAHDARTDRIVAQKEAETERKMRKMEDDYRKIMKKMGFNVLILPKGRIGEFWAKDFASRYMPEEYVDRLANSRILTVRHLLPSLQQKVDWPEKRRTIILVGVRGEVPLMHRDPRAPMIEPVPAGGMVVGYELHHNLDLDVGDEVGLLGRQFTVSKLHAERGSKDDITIWINLEEAQELLDKKGLINGILALQCFCHAEDRLGQVRSDVSRILPDTEVVEFASKILVRAEARGRAAAAAREAIEAEKRSRADLRNERESFAAVLVPVVMAGCAVWICLLAFSNVRERRPEIGILRALGLRSRQILFVFLAKAVVTGFVGAWLGWAAGLVVGAIWGGIPVEMQISTGLFDPALLLLAVTLAPALSGLASWVPALVAAQQDPAAVLSEG